MSPAAALRACDLEPIHTPGTVQPCGALMTINEAGTIDRASANAASLLDLAGDAVIGQRPGSLLAAVDDDLERCLAAPPGASGRSLRLRSRRPAKAPLDGWLHRHDGVTVLELEPAAEDDADALVLAHQAAAALRATASQNALLEVLTAQVRKLSGFDRALVYRFDDAWHGEVLAEHRADWMPSFLGHRFPASDIPRQAREIFLRNELRLIGDVAQPQAPILCDGAAAGRRRPLDLTYAIWRSPAAIHLAYLRNMQVGASLTLSLVHEDRLWGLVACHHRGPRMLGRPRRLATALVVSQAAALLRQARERQQRQRRRQREATGAQLAHQVRDGATLAEGLLGGPVPLADLVADGDRVGAAVLYEGRWRTSGDVPAQADCDRLVAWLAEHHDQDVFATHELPRHFPPAAAYANLASGLLAVRVQRPLPTYVLWFFPEILRTVTWAGNPNKPAMAGGDGDILHPRTSFAAWRENVRHTARPIDEVERDAAATLRRDIVQEDLSRQVAQAEQAVRARDFVMGVVSHDLRNPLGAIGLTAGHLQQRLERDATALAPGDVERAVARIMTAHERMRRLISDLFSMAKVTAGNLVVEPQPRAPRPLMESAVAVVAPLAESRDVDLRIEIDPACEQTLVRCDSERLLQVLGNLLGNALKFTPQGSAVRLAAQRGHDHWRFAVADGGAGIATEHLTKVFEPYWQGKLEAKQGAGMGLPIARGIVEAHGGKIWAESPAGSGAVFLFTLPDCG